MDVEHEIRNLAAETLAYSAIFGSLLAKLAETSPEMKVLCSQALKEAIVLLEATAQIQGPGPGAAAAILAADKVEQIRLIAEPGPQQPRHGV
jgi:hypothetical protein